MRTIIDLPPAQIAGLDALRAGRKVSRAAMVRQAIEQMLAAQPPAGHDVGFGIWKHKKLNSRKHVDALRAEWDAK